MKKLLALLLTLVVAGSAFAGCAAPEAAPVETAAPAEPAATEAPAEEAPAEEAPAEEAPAEEAAATPNVDAIKEAGKIVMLTNAAFPPFEYLGADNTVAGVDVDIATKIAEALGVELEVVDMNFDGIIPALLSGQGDLGVAGMTATDERRESVDFSVDYVSTTQNIIVMADNTEITNPDGLVGKTIGVQIGTTGDLFVSSMEGVGEVARFTTGPDAGAALANGQIDAVVIDAMPASQIVAANDGLMVLDEPFTEEKYAIAMAKDKEDLKAVVDAVVSEMVANGEVDALIAKHMEVIG